MVRIEMSMGDVTIQKGKNKESVRPAKNKEVLDTNAGYFYVIRCGNDSWAVISIDGKDVVVRPKAILSLTDNKTDARLNGNSSAKSFFGKKWASITTALGSDDKGETETGNAVAGVRG